MKSHRRSRSGRMLWLGCASTTIMLCFLCLWMPFLTLGFSVEPSSSSSLQGRTQTIFGGRRTNCSCLHVTALDDIFMVATSASLPRIIDDTDDAGVLVSERPSSRRRFLECSMMETVLAAVVATALSFWIRKSN